MIDILASIKIRLCLLAVVAAIAGADLDSFIRLGAHSVYQLITVVGLCAALSFWTVFTIEVIEEIRK